MTIAHGSETERRVECAVFSGDERRGAECQWWQLLQDLEHFEDAKCAEVNREVGGAHGPAVAAVENYLSQAAAVWLL